MSSFVSTAIALAISKTQINAVVLKATSGPLTLVEARSSELLVDVSINDDDFITSCEKLATKKGSSTGMASIVFTIPWSRPATPYYRPGI
uniref:BMC domain-containing protein n=1 Tax=Ascaris lumbricoides TaxID=6252 RepID=A0A0M3I0S5_ASCLU